MSKISHLCGKSKIFTIEGIQVEFKSNFITIDDLPALMSISDESTDIQKKAEMTRELAFSKMKKAIPDASDEEIKEFTLRNLKDVVNAIVEMSGMKNDVSK